MSFGLGAAVGAQVGCVGQVVREGQVGCLVVVELVVGFLVKKRSVFA